MCHNGVQTWWWYDTLKVPHEEITFTMKSSKFKEVNMGQIYLEWLTDRHVDFRLSDYVNLTQQHRL